MIRLRLGWQESWPSPLAILVPLSLIAANAEAADRDPEWTLQVRGGPWWHSVHRVTPQGDLWWVSHDLFPHRTSPTLVLKLDREGRELAQWEMESSDIDDVWTDGAGGLRLFDGMVRRYDTDGRADWVVDSGSEYPAHLIARAPAGASAEYLVFETDLPGNGRTVHVAKVRDDGVRIWSDTYTASESSISGPIDVVTAWSDGSLRLWVATSEDDESRQARGSLIGWDAGGNRLGAIWSTNVGQRVVDGADGPGQRCYVLVHDLDSGTFSLRAVAYGGSQLLDVPIDGNPASVFLTPAGVGPFVVNADLFGDTGLYRFDEEGTEVWALERGGALFRRDIGFLPGGEILMIKEHLHPYSQTVFRVDVDGNAHDLVYGTNIASACADHTVQFYLLNRDVAGFTSVEETAAYRFGAVDLDPVKKLDPLEFEQDNSTLGRRAPIHGANPGANLGAKEITWDGNELRFRVSRAGFVSLALFDVRGRRVAGSDLSHAGIGERRVSIRSEMQRLPSGIYLARVETPDGVHRKQIPIVR